MAEEGKIYVNQVGVLLEVETQNPTEDPIDWNIADVKELHVRLPDFTEVVFPATVVGSVFQYITTSPEDLPLPGTYLIQAYVSGEGYSALGETDRFRVFDRWK